MNEINKIIAEIKKKNFSSVYLLMGEEPFFIDQISDVLSEEVVEEIAKDFDKSVVYGKEITVEQIVEMAKRYPMMGSHQLIIVKEAQNLERNLDELESYFSNPQPQTVLALCFKNKKIDKRKKVYKTIVAQKGVVLESKKLYENQTVNWIKERVSYYGYSFHPSSLQMMISFLGTDLGKIDKELEKLANNVQSNTKVNPQDIEKHIGFSKEFNSFELQKTLGRRDLLNSYRIIRYMASNPRKNPLVLTLSTLFSFFQKLLIFHGLDNVEKAASVLGIHPFFVNEYQEASRLYSMKQITKILEYIQEMDLKSKGVGAQNLSDEDILKELIVKIISV